MDPDAMALFRELADRSPSEREHYYQQRQIPARLRAEVESLLQFDRSSSDWLRQGIAAAADDAAILPERPADFGGTARFALQRQLGSGAFGTVYQVWDRERQATVAVKVLHQWQPDLLFRFKREFRALVDVQHRNLVRLYELFSEGDRWFFSMELVEGESFLEYVRPGGCCNLERLRTALGQLTDGIQALHAARRLHRDLKPANALVTPAGRVVILDFSLVHEVDAWRPQAGRTLVAGTPAYMAPEQILEGQVSEATDWYAVGVMLFQALTGMLPHPTSVDPRDIEAHVPADLGELCGQLLKKRPEERPGAAAIRSAIGATAPATAHEHLAESSSDLEPFVGRSELLRRLQTAFANTQQGQLNVVLMHGRSGIGKTALVRRFLADLAHRHSNVVVLEGRCYEFESVPYKGLDALVDECSRYLQRLPASRVEALLPRDACFLPRLFPVLARIPAIAAAPARSDVGLDVQELRQRTFQALRELLARASDRQPLVIWIDDLQWGDRDSSTFLGELCAPPQPPPLLLLLTYRGDEAESNTTLEYLHQALANQRGLGTWHELEVDHLTDTESRDLLADLFRNDDQISPESFATIVREASGHPLFLQQLARFAGSHGMAGDRTSGDRLTLRTVLQDRVRDLPAFAREVLELACLAAQPLTPAILWAAAEVGDADDRAEALALLIREKLARSASAGTGGGRRVEPFHDQIRTAVVELLTTDQRRARHARLASVLAQQRDVEPQTLVTHYLGAGDRRAAFEAAVKAAGFADTQLAFDQAAGFYQTALETGDLAPDLSAQLYRKLAEALEHAGRGRDSAEAYLNAADCSGRDGPLERIELTRRAAEQLLISGNTEAGLEAIRTVLRAVKIRFPESSLQSLASLVVRRMLVMLRGVAFEKRPASQLADGERILIDTCWSVAVGLSMVDTIRGADFQARHLLLALNAGEPFRVARALAMEVAHRAVSGRRVEGRVKKLLEVAGSVAEQLEDPYSSALMANAAATFYWSNGRWMRSLERADEAQRIFTERCGSPSWETVTAQIFSMGALVRMGELNEHRRRMPMLMRAAHERGNRYAQVSLPLLSYGHVTTLADDHPEQAAESVRQLIGAWTTSRYDLQRFWATYARAEIHLYTGDGQSAWREIEANAKSVRDSLLLRIQTVRICWRDLYARCALAAAGNGRTNLVRDARRLATDLERENVQWAKGLAGLVWASVMRHGGQTAQAATLLARAEGDFAETDMKLHAATAHWIRNRLFGDSAGTGSTLDRTFEAEGVRCPSRMAAMLAPGPWH